MEYNPKKHGVLVTPEIEIKLLALAKTAGFEVKQNLDAGECTLVIGRQTFVVPNTAMYRRILAELVELASSRIAFSENQPYIDTLSRLSPQVLRRAVLQGLAERYN